MCVSLSDFVCISPLSGHWQDFNVTVTPLLSTEVRGVELLRLYGTHLLTPHKFGGASGSC